MYHRINEAYDSRGLSRTGKSIGPQRVVNLEKQCGVLQRTLTVKNNQIDNLQHENINRKEQIAKLEGQIDEFKNVIDALEKSIEELREEMITAIAYMPGGPIYNEVSSHFNQGVEKQKEERDRVDSTLEDPLLMRTPIQGDRWVVEIAKSTIYQFIDLFMGIAGI